MDQTRSARGSWKDVAGRIRADILSGAYTEGVKLPSESDLMKRHGAAKMTVHRALRELTAEGLVRSVERVGTFVMPQRAAGARKIGLVLPTTEGFLEFNLLAGVRDGLGTGEQYVLYATDNDPLTELEALNRAASEVDGILILPTCHVKTSQRLQELHDGGFPVVCVDRHCVGYRLPAVTTDNFGAAKEALQTLTAERPHRVGYFGIYDEGVSSVVDRYEAYREVCEDPSLADPTEFVRFIPPHVGPHAKVSFRLLEDALIRLLDRPDPMTLAYCVNEYYLEAIVQVCHQLPKELYENLEILAFNDWPRLRYQGFRIHTIRQDARVIGQQAANLLHCIWKGEKPSSLVQEVRATFIHSDDSYDAAQSRQSPSSRAVQARTQAHNFSSP